MGCIQMFVPLGTKWKINWPIKKPSNHHFVFLKPIVSAARMGNVDIVMSLLACDRTDVNKREPLHWAAAMGHLDVVKELLKSEKQVDVNEVKHLPLQLEHDISRYGQTFSPLHLASLFGHTSVVKGLCEDTKRRLRANIENLWGNNSPSNCNGDETWWNSEDLSRKTRRCEAGGAFVQGQAGACACSEYHSCGGCLDCNVTFAGWLGPPLGYSAFFGSASIEVGAPFPSGIYQSFVSVEGHPLMQIFWFFNSMSFFFAIATLMVGASAARPPKRGIFIGEVVQSLRASLSLAYILLTISVGRVMGAFANAGFLVLPPIPKYMVNMRVTVGIGVMVVFLAWTSSKVLYVLKIMWKRISWLYRWFVIEF